MQRVESDSPESSATAVASVSSELVEGDLVCIRGPLGSGKSVCARALARSLGVMDQMPSPTFTIVHEYRGRLPVLHVDLYRIGSPEEFEDLAIEEAMESSVTLVEWPERVPHLLTEARLVITIELGTAESVRLLTIEQRERSKP